MAIDFIADNETVDQLARETIKNGLQEFNFKISLQDFKAHQKKIHLENDEDIT